MSPADPHKYTCGQIHVWTCGEAAGLVMEPKHPRRESISTTLVQDRCSLTSTALNLSPLRWKTLAALEKRRHQRMPASSRIGGYTGGDVQTSSTVQAFACYRKTTCYRKIPFYCSPATSNCKGQALPPWHSGNTSNKIPRSIQMVGLQLPRTCCFARNKTVQSASGKEYAMR